MPTKPSAPSSRSSANPDKKANTRPNGMSMPLMQRIKPSGSDDYLEMLSKAVFQPGMSWKVVEAKWPQTREAFHEFDVDRVAHLSPDEIDALTNDTRVIRNRRKIEAVVYNARRLLELEAEHGTFKRYLRSHGGYEAAAADVRKQFKFVGESGALHFLWVVGEDVPDPSSWCAPGSP